MEGSMATLHIDPFPDASDIPGLAVVNLEATRERPSAEDAMRDQQWIEHAACRGHHELFFAARSERPQARTRRESLARQICQSCPVIEPCRATARRFGEYGFWGGESEDERLAATAALRVTSGQLGSAS